MNLNVASIGLGRLLAFLALVITLILVVVGHIPFLWIGAILLLIEAAILL